MFLALELFRDDFGALRLHLFPTAHYAIRILNFHADVREHVSRMRTMCLATAGAQRWF
jgi:hypothetical protein